MSGERGGRTPPTFWAGLLESAGKFWDLIWGLDLEAMVCIETAGRPQCVIALIFPTFQELLRLVPQCVRTRRLPPAARCRAGPTPRAPQGSAVCPEPSLIFSFNKIGGGESLRGHKPRLEKSTGSCAFSSRCHRGSSKPYSLAETLGGSPQGRRREQPQRAPFCCSVCKRGHDLEG